MGQILMTLLDADVTAILRAYRTCEFTTLARDGTPLTWPTAVWVNQDGTLLVTTSLGFPQKALNVRRDSRVGLLFSDPTGSGLDHAPQVFVSGTATCPDVIRTGPQDAEDYWRVMFQRQPHSRAFIKPPRRWLMDWYYFRLFITVTPRQVDIRRPLSELAGAPTTPLADGSLPGSEVLARFPSAVLGSLDANGMPVLARTRVTARPGGFEVHPAPGAEPVPGRAGLLVHRHDDQLNSIYNALVQGDLRCEGGSWLLMPSKVVEPSGRGRPADMVRTLRKARIATTRYLDRRGLPRPRVQWDRFAALAAENEMGNKPGNGDSGTAF